MSKRVSDRHRRIPVPATASQVEMDAILAAGYPTIGKFFRAGIDRFMNDTPEHLERTAAQKEARAAQLRKEYESEVARLDTEAMAHRSAAEAIRARRAEAAAKKELKLHLEWTNPMEEIVQFVISCLTYKYGTYTPERAIEILGKDEWFEKVKAAGWDSPSNALQMALEAIKKKNVEKVDMAIVESWMMAAPLELRR
jgi:hypothetical protein